MFSKIKFKLKDKNIANHPIERRGFVTVPFDHSKPFADKIDVFYRLIPAYGLRPSDSSKPVIVIFNGGPGFASSAYRTLDFDYEKASLQKSESFDRFRYLLNTHRILLIDQRGTDGHSAPLDMDDPNLDADLIAKYFSSDSHAQDYAAVINAVIPREETFFIIAQSYGGMPGMQYLSLTNARRPNGIVFSCSALPYENTLEQMFSRRQEQLALNVQLQKSAPHIEDLLEKTENHFDKIGINPVRINGLYTWLGNGVSGVWEKDFVLQLDKISNQTREEIENNPYFKLGEVNLLNYILSSANFTPGYTDRTLAQLSSVKIPFEPWMLDENKILMLAGQDGSWREQFVDRMDKNPPPQTFFQSVEELRKAIAENQILFTPADNDAYVPADTYEKGVAKFRVEGHTEVRRLPGGHHAIFLEKGHEVFLEWSKNKISHSGS